MFFQILFIFFIACSPSLVYSGRSSPAVFKTIYGGVVSCQKCGLLIFLLSNNLTHKSVLKVLLRSVFFKWEVFNLDAVPNLLNAFAELSSFSF